ncbi:MAG TPA: recombinase family protein [Epulopiscium sp.]|nr:recombinase family protein [Candidatus Epulonipiscium sp.]
MKIAIYSRKSKLTEKGDSTFNQIQLCKDYAKEFFPSNDDIFIYTDEGFSGGNTKRPMFTQMIADAKEKKFNILICYRLDRISRNIAQFSNTYEVLQKYHVEFVSVKEQFDTSSPIGRAMLNIAMVFAQLERETIAERIKDNMYALACSGRWLGGTCPTGFKSEPIEYYDNNLNKKKMYKLVSVPEEINLIIMIFNSFISFKKLRKVESYFLEQGIKTKNNCNFSAATIRDVLINPVYAYADASIYDYFTALEAKVCGTPTDYNGDYGTTAYNRTDQDNKSGKPKSVDQWIIAIGKHKGIIPGSKWVEVQRILRKNSKQKCCRDSITDGHIISF